MFSPIICPVRNCMALTRKAIASFRAQDIDDAVIFVINNGSQDGTTQWLNTQRDIIHMHYEPGLSVAASWNVALSYVFRMGAEYALVVNNDVELRRDTYRRLVEDGGPFVTAVGKREVDLTDLSVPDPERRRPHPDFSCYLIRRSVYDAVGPFDENFLIAYCEDSDFHVRMHQKDIHAYCLDLPFLHHGAQTIKYADMSEVRKIQAQAEKNRAYFKAKYGFVVASKEYYDFFQSSPPDAI